MVVILPIQEVDGLLMMKPIPDTKRIPLPCLPPLKHKPPYTSKRILESPQGPLGPKRWAQGKQAHAFLGSEQDPQGLKKSFWVKVGGIFLSNPCDSWLGCHTHQHPHTIRTTIPSRETISQWEHFCVKNVLNLISGISSENHLMQQKRKKDIWLRHW